jgi:hypothetical protein
MQGRPRDCSVQLVWPVVAWEMGQLEAPRDLSRMAQEVNGLISILDFISSAHHLISTQHWEETH